MTSRIRVSALQIEILTALAKHPNAESVNDRIGALPFPADILKSLGRDPSPSTRTTLSRALKRLERVKLAARFTPRIAVRGHAYRYAITAKGRQYLTKPNLPQKRVST